MIRRLYCVHLFLVAILHAPHLQAAITADHPLQHFFNSRLLNEEEMQVSVFGTAEIGVTENLQLGTQGLVLLLRKMPNVFLKHRMFKFGESETSFTSFSLLQPRLKSSSDDPTFADEYSQGIASIHGVVTGYVVNDRLTFNFGPMRFYSLFDTTQEGSNNLTLKTRSEIEAYGALLGVDFLDSEEWSFTAFTLLPLFINADIVGDTVDGSVTMLPGTDSFQKGYFLFYAYVTRSWESFNMEGGFGFFAKQVHPYVSLYWRL